MTIKLAMHLGLVFRWTPCKGTLLWIFLVFCANAAEVTLSEVCKYWNCDDFGFVIKIRQISGVSDLLKRSSPSRIVIVASLAHILGKLDLDDLNFEKSFGGDKVYCSSKLANILISNELARKLKGTGILFKVSSLLYQCPQLLLAWDKFVFSCGYCWTSLWYRVKFEELCRC